MDHGHTRAFEHRHQRGHELNSRQAALIQRLRVEDRSSKSPNIRRADLSTAAWLIGLRSLVVSLRVLLSWRFAATSTLQIAPISIPVRQGSQHSYELALPFFIHWRCVAARSRIRSQETEPALIGGFRLPSIPDAGVGKAGTGRVVNQHGVAQAVARIVLSQGVAVLSHAFDLWRLGQRISEYDAFGMCMEEELCRALQKRAAVAHNLTEYAVRSFSSALLHLMYRLWFHLVSKASFYSSRSAVISQDRVSRLLLATWLAWTYLTRGSRVADFAVNARIKADVRQRFKNAAGTAMRAFTWNSVNVRDAALSWFRFAATLGAVAGAREDRFLGFCHSVGFKRGSAESTNKMSACSRASPDFLLYRFLSFRGHALEASTFSEGAIADSSAVIRHVQRLVLAVFCRWSAHVVGNEGCRTNKFIMIFLIRWKSVVLNRRRRANRSVVLGAQMERLVGRTIIYSVVSAWWGFVLLRKALESKIAVSKALEARTAVLENVAEAGSFVDICALTFAAWNRCSQRSYNHYFKWCRLAQSIRQLFQTSRANDARGSVRRACLRASAKESASCLSRSLLLWLTWTAARRMEREFGDAGSRSRIVISTQTRSTRRVLRKVFSRVAAENAIAAWSCWRASARAARAERVVVRERKRMSQSCVASLSKAFSWHLQQKELGCCSLVFARWAKSVYLSLAAARGAAVRTSITKRCRNKLLFHAWRLSSSGSSRSRGQSVCMNAIFEMVNQKVCFSVIVSHWSCVCHSRKISRRFIEFKAFRNWVCCSRVSAVLRAAARVRAVDAETAGLYYVKSLWDSWRLVACLSRQASQRISAEYEVERVAQTCRRRERAVVRLMSARSMYVTRQSLTKAVFGLWFQQVSASKFETVAAASKYHCLSAQRCRVIAKNAREAIVGERNSSLLFDVVRGWNHETLLNKFEALRSNANDVQVNFRDKSRNNAKRLVARINSLEELTLLSPIFSCWSRVAADTRERANVLTQMAWNRWRTVQGLKAKLVVQMERARMERRAATDARRIIWSEWRRVLISDDMELVFSHVQEANRRALKLRALDPQRANVRTIATQAEVLALTSLSQILGEKKAAAIGTCEFLQRQLDESMQFCESAADRNRFALSVVNAQINQLVAEVHIKTMWGEWRRATLAQICQRAQDRANREALRASGSEAAIENERIQSQLANRQWSKRFCFSEWSSHVRKQKATNERQGLRDEVIRASRCCAFEARRGRACVQAMVDGAEVSSREASIRLTFCEWRRETCEMKTSSVVSLAQEADARQVCVLDKACRKRFCFQEAWLRRCESMAVEPMERVFGLWSRQSLRDKIGTTLQKTAVLTSRSKEHAMSFSQQNQIFQEKSLLQVVFCEWKIYGKFAKLTQRTLACMLRVGNFQQNSRLHQILLGWLVFSTGCKMEKISAEKRVRSARTMVCVNFVASCAIRNAEEGWVQLVLHEWRQAAVVGKCVAQNKNQVLRTCTFFSDLHLRLLFSEWRTAVSKAKLYDVQESSKACETDVRRLRIEADAIIHKAATLLFVSVWNAWNGISRRIIYRRNRAKDAAELVKLESNYSRQRLCLHRYVCRPCQFISQVLQNAWAGWRAEFLAQRIEACAAAASFLCSRTKACAGAVTTHLAGVATKCFLISLCREWSAQVSERKADAIAKSRAAAAFGLLPKLADAMCVQLLCYEWRRLVSTSYAEMEIKAQTARCRFDTLVLAAFGGWRVCTIRSHHAVAKTNTIDLQLAAAKHASKAHRFRVSVKSMAACICQATAMSLLLRVVASWRLEQNFATEEKRRREDLARQTASDTHREHQRPILRQIISQCCNRHSEMILRWAWSVWWSTRQVERTAAEVEQVSTRTRACATAVANYFPRIVDERLAQLAYREWVVLIVRVKQDLARQAASDTNRENQRSFLQHFISHSCHRYSEMILQRTWSSWWYTYQVERTVAKFEHLSTRTKACTTAVANQFPRVADERLVQLAHREWVALICRIKQTAEIRFRSLRTKVCASSVGSNLAKMVEYKFLQSTFHQWVAHVSNRHATSKMQCQFMLLSQLTADIVMFVAVGGWKSEVAKAVRKSADAKVAESRAFSASFEASVRRLRGGVRLMARRFAHGAGTSFLLRVVATWYWACRVKHEQTCRAEDLMRTKLAKTKAMVEICRAAGLNTNLAITRMFVHSWWHRTFEKRRIWVQFMACLLVRCRRFHKRAGVLVGRRVTSDTNVTVFIVVMWRIAAAESRWHRGFEAVLEEHVLHLSHKHSKHKESMLHASDMSARSRFVGVLLRATFSCWRVAARHNRREAWHAESRQIARDSVVHMIHTTWQVSSSSALRMALNVWRTQLPRIVRVRIQWHHIVAVIVREARASFSHSERISSATLAGNMSSTQEDRNQGLLQSFHIWALAARRAQRTAFETQWSDGHRLVEMCRHRVQATARVLRSEGQTLLASEVLLAWKRAVFVCQIEKALWNATIFRAWQAIATAARVSAEKSRVRQLLDLVAQRGFARAQALSLHTEGHNNFARCCVVWSSWRFYARSRSSKRKRSGNLTTASRSLARRFVDYGRFVSLWKSWCSWTDSCSSGRRTENVAHNVVAHAQVRVLPESLVSRPVKLEAHQTESFSEVASSARILAARILWGWCFAVERIRSSRLRLENGCGFSSGITEINPGGGALFRPRSTNRKLGCAEVMYVWKHLVVVRGLRSCEAIAESDQCRLISHSWRCRDWAAAATARVECTRVVGRTFVMWRVNVIAVQVREMRQAYIDKEIQTEEAWYRRIGALAKCLAKQRSIGPLRIMWASWALEVASTKTLCKINAIHLPDILTAKPFRSLDQHGIPDSVVESARGQLELTGGGPRRDKYWIESSLIVPQSPTLTEPLAEPLADQRPDNQSSPAKECEISIVSSSLTGWNGRGPLPLELGGDIEDDMPSSIDAGTSRWGDETWLLAARTANFVDAIAMAADAAARCKPIVVDVPKPLVSPDVRCGWKGESSPAWVLSGESPRQDRRPLAEAAAQPLGRTVLDRS